MTFRRFGNLQFAGFSAVAFVVVVSLVVSVGSPVSVAFWLVFAAYKQHS